jgi:hypothetical protein
MSCTKHRAGEQPPGQGRPGPPRASGRSAALPRRGFRWPSAEQPAPPRATGRLHGGRVWLAPAVRTWRPIGLVSAIDHGPGGRNGRALGRRRLALQVLLADVPVQVVARSEHQAAGHAFHGHRWLLSQHRAPRRLHAAPAERRAAQTGQRLGGAREPTQPSRPAAAGHRRRCRATTDRRIAKAAAGLHSSAPSAGAGWLRSSRRFARMRFIRRLTGSTICSTVSTVPGRLVNRDSPVAAPAEVRPMAAPSANTPSSTASANAALVGRVGRMVSMLVSTLPIGRRQSIAPQARAAQRLQVTPVATRSG